MDTYRANMASLGAQNPLLQIAEDVYSRLDEVTQTKLVLTDDMAPVEVLGQKVLNDIVADSLTQFKQELGSSKNIFDIFKLISG
jgi:hypothetical protein